jgi:putative tryptophan/tyrosine transport system substrate-binding protein
VKRFTAPEGEQGYTGRTMRRTGFPIGRRPFLRGGLALAGLGLLSACGGAPFAAKLPAVGYVGLGNPPGVGPNPNYDAFIAGLGELGWVDGRTLTLHARLTQGRADLVPEVVDELVRLPVDVLAASGAVGAAAAAKLTTALPIVFASAAEPVEQGLVCSLARPCANVTGLSDLAEGLDGKRLELLTEAVPGLVRVAILWHEPVMLPAFRRTQAAAQATRIRLVSMGVANAEAIPAAFQAAVGEGVQALVTVSNGLTAGASGRIVELAARHRLPAMFQTREFVAAGGLMAYGPSPVDQHRRAAAYVDKLLKGAKPADLPVEQPTTFDFIVNLRAAQPLDLAIPRTVLHQATELIQ